LERVDVLFPVSGSSKKSSMMHTPSSYNLRFAYGQIEMTRERQQSLILRWRNIRDYQMHVVPGDGNFV
jgi:hypothetical protein